MVADSDRAKSFGTFPPAPPSVIGSKSLKAHDYFFVTSQPQSLDQILIAFSFNGHVPNCLMKNQGIIMWAIIHDDSFDVGYNPS